jgi:hypothetical protein
LEEIFKNETPSNSRPAARFQAFVFLKKERARAGE